MLLETQFRSSLSPEPPFFHWSTDKCPVLQCRVSDSFVLPSDLKMPNFVCPSEFRACQRVPLSGRWFYRAHGERKPSLIWATVQGRWRGVKLLPVVSEHEKGKSSELIHYPLRAQRAVYLRDGKNTRRGFIFLDTTLAIALFSMVLFQFRISQRMVKEPKMSC